MAHSVTVSFVNSACGIDSCILKSQAFAFGSAVAMICSNNSGSSSAHTHRAIVHVMSECIHESSFPQMAHRDDVDILR